MKSISWNTPSVRHELAALKQAAPFVYGLTNYVAANLSANALLAVGAAPAIGAAADWPARFGAGAGALWINTAALMSSGADTLRAAARAAAEAGTRWVLDPVAVGAGAPEYDAIVHDLLAFKPTVIRGNASELIALAGGAAAGKGVDTTASSESALAFIGDLARRSGAIVAVSGPTDYVTDGVDTLAIAGGDARLTRVTGAGCALGALIAALLAQRGAPLLATGAAHAIYAIAAERAADARGTASFGVRFVDELSLLDPAE
ncbi:hydroxyethylthiazole kinase [Burkholderia oklahomensis]|uniref:Hydroxyethylthiazole kinase n=4 Tax=Burkholderia oklahomensis TaxID=342113 RepID=A0AAI8BE20_9BURK|nr:hydroxyethylthiazole kinase [Burkholderia oklahomensis]AIO70562.1 hydroxyethylthiazole kinase family protein [Burkholderia oklahomensis]AOI40577.1 hydroxyethylthiazole kinase [Burkholderia oklahomensis EO147]KUY51794.1 hydroxyethylthiazole kinase [Burkholderia oklahomensis EO147]QPS40376.1 hydroxyethylthiazole kinase [Burkholderia oklahomensis]